MRSKGQSLGSGTHWIFAALITLFMPFFLEQYSPATVFTFMMILQLIFVFYLMPATKGRPLEDLSAKLFKQKEDSH
ncbi:MAG: SP family xylose:H+ symportor-like MFS transporter [Paraglaciecola sp.]